MSIVFGDDDPDDGYVRDNVPDPEQVARRLHELRMTERDWDDLSDEERAIALAIVVALLAWLRREGTNV